MKKCSSCQDWLPVKLFNVSKGRKDGLQTLCRPCNKTRSKRYYSENKAKHKAVVTERKHKAQARNREFIRELLLGSRCLDCSETDLRVLEFDHVRGPKSGNIAEMSHSPVSLRSLKAEIEKCEIRCANCHRKRTADVQNSWRSTPP